MSQFNRHTGFHLELTPAARQTAIPATELVLIRDLPGSGKSTMAKALALVGYEHYEADQFLMVDGVYHYDATRIRDAHSWCQKMTRQALTAGKRVVVSNTCTRLQGMEPYRAIDDECPCRRGARPVGERSWCAG